MSGRCPGRESSPAQHSTREGLKLGAQRVILKFLVECWADTFSLRGLAPLNAAIAALIGFNWVLIPARKK